MTTNMRTKRTSEFKSKVAVTTQVIVHSMRASTKFRVANFAIAG